MAGAGSDITLQLQFACFNTRHLPSVLLDAMIQASSAGDVGAVKAMEGAADPNAPKTEADLPAGVNKQLAQNVVASVIAHCDTFGGLSFLRKFFGLPANDATPNVIMGCKNRISGFCGPQGFPYTLGLARDLTESLQFLDAGDEVLCDSDGSVKLPTLYTIVHVAPLVWPEIARMIVNSESLAYSVCFFLEAWNANFREVAASGVACTTAGMKKSWRAVADRACANLLDFNWLDPRLLNLAALARRLETLADLAVHMRLTCTLFKRCPVQLQQHVVVVPMEQIYESPHLPTFVIATHAAASTLGFLQAAFTHVAKQHDDTTALERICTLTEDGVGSIILDALRNGGLKLSLTLSVDVALRAKPLALLTPHRNEQLKDFGFAFTSVSPLPHQSLALAQPLEDGSFAFATIEGCSGYAEGARFAVFDKVQKQLGLAPELDAAAMEERLQRMRAANATLGTMTAREGGEVAAAAAVLVERGSHAPGFGTLATEGLPNGVAAVKCMTAREGGEVAAAAKVLVEGGSHAPGFGTLATEGLPNGAAAVKAKKCDHKKMAATQKNNRNSRRCTNLACEYKSACAEDHAHTRFCVKAFDPRGTVHANSLGRGKAFCYYCDLSDLELERA